MNIRKVSCLLIARHAVCQLADQGCARGLIFVASIEF